MAGKKDRTGRELLPDKESGRAKKTKQPPKTPKKRRLQGRARLASPESNAEDEASSPSTRPRRRSEADKRNKLERHRKLQQEAVGRDARSNNRFLRAMSKQHGAAKATPDPASPRQGDENKDDDSDNDTSSRLLPKRDAAPPATSTEGIVVTPGTWFGYGKPLVSAQSWAEDIKQRDAAGLHVDAEQQQFMHLEPSTIDRLEERLQREFMSSGKQERQSEGASHQSRSSNSSKLLVEELLAVKPLDPDAIVRNLPPDAKVTSTEVRPESSTFPEELCTSSQKANHQFALLELFVDRLVLDDHSTFTLADRLATQLRALYAAYSRMQQAQPWSLRLKRIDGYFSVYTDKLAEGTRMNDTSTFTRVIEEIDQLFVDLDALGHIHQQIQAKSNELRDASTQDGCVVPVRIKRRQRTQPIDLSRTEAMLEILGNGSDNQQGENDENEMQTLQRLSERLSTLVTTASQALKTVLQLESDETNYRSKELSIWTPRFYVALRINGKIACTTKTRPYSRGEVRFSERLRFTLPYFPLSVCAEVYERRFIMRDELLSSNAIPVVVPGENISRQTSSSLFHDWNVSDSGRLVSAASLAPSDEWYQFSSAATIARSRWHPSFHNSPLFAHVTRRSQGRLRVRATWLQETSLEQPQSNATSTSYLPPRRPEIAGGLQHISSSVQLIGTSPQRDSNALSLYLCDSGFSSERDFLRLIDSRQLTIDPNDPENVAVKRLQTYYSKLQQEEDAIGLGRRKIFRTSEVSCALAASASGRGLTKRNRLLRVRDREHVARHGTSFCDAISSQESGKVAPPRWNPQHTVFDEPLPMLEYELLADERLLRLLRPELHAFDRRLLSEEADRADASIIERYRMQQLLKLQDFRERIRQTQIVSNYNTTNDNQDTRMGRTKPLAAIVQEKPLPLFPGVFELPSLGVLFAPRRRLRPRVKAPVVLPSAQTAANWPTACTLYVQVQKAANVPVRIKPPRNAAEAEEIATTGRKRRDTLQRSKKSPRTASLASGGSDNQTEDTLETPRKGAVLEYESHVFVQVTFQGKTRQTSCTAVMGSTGKKDHGGGAHPVWMETLALPFRPPRDDWSPEAIESSQDIIRFTLFDQVTRSASTSTIEEERKEGEERLGAQTRSLHRENCFLGSLEVPFLTLVRAGRLEGSLRCEIPVEHLGYANLQIGASHGSFSTAVNTSTAPPSIASSDGDTGSPRQRRSRGLSLSSPMKKRASLALSPEKSSYPSSPQSPQESEVDDDHDDPEESGVARAAREATYLKLTLQLDPVLPVVNQTTTEDDQMSMWGGSLSTAQDKLLLERAQRWSAAARRSTPANVVRRRTFNVFVRNLSHGATFLPRFLRAQQPPKELLTASLQSLVRYVSLIPFLDDWLAFDGAKDVWNTSQEFLNMGAGDHEEHAVLLANFFLWYDKRHPISSPSREGANFSGTYLVLGRAVPEGDVVYVLRRGVLWNGSTGVGYAITDPHCPLRDVSLVVSSKNVFANVQPLPLTSGIPVGSCHELNWDVETNAKCWKPFFLEQSVSMPPSVQRRELVYSVTPPEFVEQVERELREALKLAVRRWRSSHFATNFNELAGLQLREHLVVLEREANGNNEVPNESTLVDNQAQHSPRSTRRLKQRLKLKLALPTQRLHPGVSVLRELQRSREISGLPLHVSFTDIPRVLELVESMNIHYNERPGVEFALAVYVCGHPNCVLSVWVYLAALVPL